jgi:small subunit ribosomal protein S20
MPNIKQQVRRVATTERERLENLRWRSTTKTMLRRLQTAVEDGDADLIAAEHAAYVRWMDKAATRGAIHPSRAARKKSQAAKLVASATAA